MPSTSPGPLRIGEFARRVGVNPDLLRAWERRYGVLRPIRSAGGYRLYTDDDAERVARMQAALDAGLSAAEAARVAAESDRPAEGLLDDAAERLFAAIEAYDEAAMHAVLDEALAGFALDTVLRELVLPTLRRVGSDWSEGRLEVSQEHFASHVVRGRLVALARLWGRGAGPLAVLACAPGELHDIGLLAFGLALRSHGWRIVFLGANTPTATIARTVETIEPALTVVAAHDAALLEPERAGLRKLGKTTRLVLAGPGASDELASKLGVESLNGDLLAAATRMARG